MTKVAWVSYLKGELKEVNPHPLKAINLVVGGHCDEYLSKLLSDAQKLHKAGILIKDRTRKRTLGGCFFFVEKYRKKGLL